MVHTYIVYYYIVLYYIILYYIILYYIMLYYIILLYYIIVYSYAYTVPFRWLQRPFPEIMMKDRGSMKPGLGIAQLSLLQRFVITNGASKVPCSLAIQF